jgi:hypothetical protein
MVGGQAELHGRDVGYRPANRHQRIRRRAAIDAGQVDRDGRQGIVQHPGSTTLASPKRSV